MDSPHTLSAPDAATSDSARKQRISHLGLETGDIVVVKTILQASSRLSRQFEYSGAGPEGFIDVLFVNGEDAQAIDTSERLCRQRPDMCIVMVGGNASTRAGDRYIRRPISPKLLEAALLPGDGADDDGRQRPRPALSALAGCKKLRILVVDDSMPAREFIRIKIEDLCKHKQGMHIDTASSGEQALQKCADNHYDLVFLDVEMPGMDGFTTCANLKRENSAIRVVMLTSKSLSQDYVRGREVGCNHYLTKPPQDNDVKTILTLASLTKTTAQESA